MVKYSSLRPFGGNDLVPYHVPYQESYPESEVDRTSFINNVEAARVLATRIARGSVSGIYDTPDDIKAGFTGEVFARKKGTDVTEITEIVKDLNKQADDSIAQDINRLKIDIDMNKLKAQKSDNQTDIKANSDSC